MVVNTREAVEKIAHKEWNFFIGVAFKFFESGEFIPDNLICPMKNS